MIILLFVVEIIISLCDIFLILIFFVPQVNGIDVVGWDTESVIDLLRKTRGKISVTVLQPLS